MCVVRSSFKRQKNKKNGFPLDFKQKITTCSLLTWHRNWTFFLPKTTSSFKFEIGILELVIDPFVVNDSFTCDCSKYSIMTIYVRYLKHIMINGKINEYKKIICSCFYVKYRKIDIIVECINLKGLFKVITNCIEPNLAEV
jgi:hypothetical protein